MSVRAYRITSLEYEDDPTFNLWHDILVMKLLEGFINRQLNEENGIFEINETEIKEAIKKLEENKKVCIEIYSKEEVENSKKILKKMLKDCQEGKGYCKYYAF